MGEKVFQKKLIFSAGKAEVLIKKIQKIARENDGEARLVGGAVRNWLMKIPVEEFDMAINIPILNFVKLLNKQGIKFYETGLSHGTITVVENDVYIEVTQTRKDIKCDGRHSKVESVKNWDLDAQRRDFTVNAMYLTDSDELYDPFNGLSDLRNKKLTFIGSADERIQEDYLRILRAFRFFAWLPGFFIPEDEIRALKRHQRKLGTLSCERITDEVSKWLMADDPIKSLCLAKKIGLDKLGLGFSFSLNNLEVEILKKSFLKLDWLARLAAITPIDKVDKIQNIMRFSRQQRERFKRLMQDLTDLEVSELATEKWQKVAYWHATDLSDKVRIYSIRNGFMFPDNRWKFIEAFERPIFPITGEDLKKAGWTPGPKMGLKLSELERQWVLNEFKLPEIGNYTLKSLDYKTKDS